jgi:hypothetical protein
MKLQIPALLIALFVLGLGAFSANCAVSNVEGFAIYLTKADIPPAQMEALSHVDISDKPVIGLKDIVGYNGVTHEITLSAEAFKRVVDLEVPVRGTSFLVCVDKAPIYWGAFWTPVSSISFDGVTIWKPFGAQETKTVALELGYPSVSFYGGDDPRDNPLILDSLDKAGKLIARPGDKLPDSMKGYELYSWTVDGRQYFSLITGTNRTKTTAEITASEYAVAKNGWVHITVTGTDAIKAVLGMLPQGEFVTWPGPSWTTDIPAESALFSLPDTATINIIKEQAARSGINLTIIN